MMKRSGKMRLEWRVRWVELDIHAGLLKYYEFEATPMHEALQLKEASSPTVKGGALSLMGSMKEAMLEVFAGHSGGIEAAGVVRVKGYGASLATIDAVDYLEPCLGDLGQDLRPFCFLLKIDDKQHYFCCSNVEEKLAWIEAITGLINQHYTSMATRYQEARGPLGMPDGPAPYDSPSSAYASPPPPPLPAVGIPVGETVLDRVAEGEVQYAHPVYGVGSAVPPPSQVTHEEGLRLQLHEIAERLSAASEEVAMQGEVLDGDAAGELLMKLQMDRALLVPLCGAYEEEGTSEEGLAKALMWLDACDHLIEVAQNHAGSAV